MSSIKKAFTISELLDSNILELFGLQNLSENEKKEFLDFAAGIVLERVVGQIEKDLSEDKRKEFFELFKEGASDEAKTAFLKERVPDLEAIVFEEILKFKDEAIRVANEIQNTKSQVPNKSE